MANVFFQTVFFQFFADVSSSATLPDNRVIDWLASFFFPHDGGFALVGDTDTGNLIGVNVGFRQHFHQHRALR